MSRDTEIYERIILSRPGLRFLSLWTCYYDFRDFAFDDLVREKGVGDDREIVDSHGAEIAFDRENRARIVRDCQDTGRTL